MTLSRLKLRQKLLILLFGVGGIGLASYMLVIAISYYQLSAKFIPENRALREVESRTGLLLQNYFRFMLTPELINVDGFDGELTLIRENLDTYARLTKGQAQKKALTTEIGESIRGLELAGKEMVSAREDLAQALTQQEQLERDIEEVFNQYRSAVSDDIGNSIESQNWAGLTRNYLPELRMIDRVNQLYLTLSLRIREYQNNPDGQATSDIYDLQQRLSISNTMLEIYVANSNYRAQLAARIISIDQNMLSVVNTFTMARQRAEYAFSRAEQSGIDLNESMQEAIAVSDSVGWNDFRTLLIALGSILFLTLVIGYLFIYFGFDRILRPLEKLQVVISRLGKGDFKQRSKDTGRTDEIGLLATTFNHMADQLEENVLLKQQLIDQLEQKNTELERFTYTVSHELKSPLVTVNGFLGHLKRDLDDDNRDKIADDMNKISLAIDVMNKQLEDLLELSRVGRVANPPTYFTVDSLCRGVVQMMQGTIEENNANVEIAVDMPQVFADQARIGEVIKNLIENGIKFTSTEQQPRITISAEQKQGKVLCRVQDNGPGIEPRYQDKVFGLFDRLDSNIPGTGIGLAMVKRIIESQSGDIWIESQGDGQGSCFCFTLPAQRGT